MKYFFKKINLFRKYDQQNPYNDIWVAIIQVFPSEFYFSSLIIYFSASWSKLEVDFCIKI